MMRKQTITWRQAAAKWSKGEPIWSAEMGGIGPGYEQCIQELIFETLSRWPEESPIPDLVGKKYPQDFEKHFDAVAHDLDKKHGFSGAQVGAAKSVAYQFMRYGYAEMMNKLEEDRHILVSKSK